MVQEKSEESESVFALDLQLKPNITFVDLFYSNSSSNVLQQQQQTLQKNKKPETIIEFKCKKCNDKSINANLDLKFEPCIG